MFYDDGYNPDEYKIVKGYEPPEGYVRAFQLSNGDVITIHNLLLEFEDTLFYEVKEPRGIVNPYFERTGRVFTMEQLNKKM